MTKRYLLLIFYIFILPDIYAISSQENFYSVGSDFIVLLNPENSPDDYPQIYTLYPNTLVSLDINNDGAYDYNYLFENAGLHILSTNWQIIEGTRIHSNKPIQYVQQIYLSTASKVFPSANFKEEKLLTIPQIPSWKTEYLIRTGTWHILSDAEFNISIDTSADGIIDSTFFINKTTKVLNVTKITKISSDKKFIAYSTSGLSGLISKDFLSNENKILLIIIENNTQTSFDYNVDGVPDYESLMNVGEYNFTLPKPSRIMSNKNISAFGYVDGLTGSTVHTKSYFPLPLTSSVSNDFSVGINNDFQWATDKGHSLIGIFNNDSVENMNFDFEVYDSSFEKIKEYTNLTTGKTQSLGAINGEFYINSSLPLIDFAYYYYNSGSYIRYYVGHTIAYMDIYLTTSPKSKNIVKNSSAIFNSRVFNPFKDTTVNNIIVKFPINNAFSMPIASINGRKVSLTNDEVLNTFSKAITLANDGQEDYFLFIYEGVLEPETFLDIDFSLATPSENGVKLFPSATLTYSAPTWII